RPGLAGERASSGNLRTRARRPDATRTTLSPDRRQKPGTAPGVLRGRGGPVIAVGVAHVLRGPAKAQEGAASEGTPLDRAA
ncbi:MAG: hypothetical protein WAL13_21325, partial [Trebonia sp.]